MRVRTRSGRNVTGSLPELAGIAEQVPDGTVLDGELVAGGGRGIDFYTVAPSMAARRRRAPLAFVAFDVPHLAGEPTIGLTYRDRRRLLELLELNGPAWCTVPSFDAEADDVLEECARLRLEGLVAKRLSGREGPAGGDPLPGSSDQVFPSSSWSEGQLGCIRCHWSGARRMSTSSSWARSWVMRATSSRSLPCALDGERRAHEAEVAGAVEVDGGRQERRAGAEGEGGRTAGQRGPLAEELDLHPVAGQVAVAEQAEDVVVLEGAHALGAGRRPERDDVDPDVAAQPDEPLGQLGRLDRLDDRGDLAALALGQPEGGPLPPAQVGQGQDHAAALVERVVDVLVAVDRPCRPR